MERYKSRDRGMIRSRCSFQEKHEVNVPFSGSRDAPTGKQTVYGRVDQYSMQPITFAVATSTYYDIGQAVRKAFS